LSEKTGRLRHKRKQYYIKQIVPPLFSISTQHFSFIAPSRQTARHLSSFFSIFVPLQSPSPQEPGFFVTQNLPSSVTLVTQAVLHL